MADTDDSSTRRIRANRTQGWRAVGGRLTVSPTAVRFEPHGFERSTGGSAWATPTSSIVQVDAAPAFKSGGLPFGGGIRTRLRVRLVDGGEELFVVPRLGEVIDLLCGLIDPPTDEVAPDA